MTKEQIQKIIQDHPRAINLIPSSHLGDLPDLVEAHAEVFTITRAECVKNYDKDGSSWMPSAVAIARLATMAGISFYDLGENTRKEGPRCWVGKCQPYRMGPDGKNEDGPACEKEFDADLQLEAMGLRGKTKWEEVNGKNVKSSVPYEQKELNAQLAQFLVTGRERANTGAKTRAVMQLLGQPRAFKGIFSEKGADTDSREFLVSRIIWNTKNKMLMERMLDNLAGNTAALFGPRHTAQIAASAQSEELPMRNATPGAEGAGAPTNDDWGEPTTPAAGATPTELEFIIGALTEWAVAGGVEGKRAQAIIDRGESDLRILRASLEIIKYLQTNNQRGRKSCLDALDMLVPDVIVLESTVGKIKGVAA
jgi:hypothetical protein